MKKIFFSLFLLAILSFITLQPVKATIDPLSTPNNKFGIHIVDENDLDDAASLVNSSGGSWGYVIMVITENDRNIAKWQSTFDKMRRLKLIPIIRLATHPEGEFWAKPKKDDAATWAKFLSSLNWVVENRYVILFNEPNHAKEWGGALDPAGYGEIAQTFAQKLKEKSSDFFVMPAGFDASAPNSSETMEMGNFLKQMLTASPEFFKNFDGWVSHSYPNPGFSGSPNAFGKGTIRSYLWETSFLKNLGVVKNLPVFITETGWIHDEGKAYNSSYLSINTLADFFADAFTDAWNNDNLALVAPFLLNYQDEPFDHFSWKKIATKEFYPQYERVKTLEKTKGEPAQMNNAVLTLDAVGDQLVDFSDYEFTAEVYNTGQSIWNREDNFALEVSGDIEPAGIYIDEVPTTEPFKKALIRLKIKTPKKDGKFKLSLQMKKGNATFGQKWEKEITLVPPPSFTLQTKFWFKKDQNTDNSMLLIYNNGDLLQKIENVQFKNGTAEIKEIRDVIPGQNYRFVLLRPYFLPRQTISPLWEGKTVLIFKRMLPVDFDNNGKLDLNDLGELIRNPRKSFSLLF